MGQTVASYACYYQLTHFDDISSFRNDETAQSNGSLLMLSGLTQYFNLSFYYPT